ncbi:MAG: hypothetical protein ACXWCY_28265 [Burkholderiales bacterium]
MHPFAALFLSASLVVTAIAHAAEQPHQAAADYPSKALAQGVEPVGGTPQQFREFLKAEMEQWGRVIKEAGIRVE